jgi:sugar/nucleoside kinase (ribokinase family)
MMDLVSIGHILNETIIFEDGSTQHVLGSPAAYTTVCASRLGAKTGIVTHAGNDIPKRFIDVFGEVGVDRAGFNLNAPCTRTNELGNDPHGRKRILRYSKVGPPITVNCIPEAYYKSKVFYICGLDFEIHIDVLKKLSKQKGLLAGDLGGLSGAGQPMDGSSKYHNDPDFYREYLSHLEIVKASDLDCFFITGREDNVPKFLREVLSWGPRMILLTKGAKGTDIYTADGVQSVPALSVDGVIDTTGAGDCFTAGFLYRYSQTGDAVDAVRFGSAVSSFVIQRTGGVTGSRMPAYSEIEERLTQHIKKC